MKKQTSSQTTEEPQESKNERKDERKAECPNCNVALKKVPGAKTKCPHCKEFMFVRTTPDKVRLVVTKEEVDRIDEQWRVEQEKEAILPKDEQFEDRKQALRKKFGGQEPSDHDVRWSLLNERLLNTANNTQWPLYVHTQCKMAGILYQEGKLKAALRMYLRVCYLDLNGPLNVPTATDENGNNIIDDPELLKPFEPEKGGLESDVIEKIQRIIKKLNISKEEVKDMFMDVGSQEHESIKTPIAPSECFEKLEAEIWQA